MTGHRYRYGLYEGGADPLAPPYDVRSAVDRVGADVLAGGSLRDALRDLLRRGPDDGRGRGRGLDDLAALARRLRREAMRRGNLDGAVTRARAMLDQALAAERETLAGRDDETARFNEAVLDNLPRSTARAVEELEGYDWANPDARRIYQQILEGLRRDVLEQRFEGLRDALRGADPADSQRLRDMLQDLNALLDRHARGEDTADAFAEFMRRHGEFFPEQPSNVDELVDALARRAAEGERLMRSLSAQQRQELAGLMESALGQAGIAGEMQELTRTLRSLRPDLPWGRRSEVRGEEGLGYGEAASVLGEISELDDLLEQLGQEHPGATLDDVDVDAVARNLGRDAAADLRRLQELERELRRQGWLTLGPGGLTLSPKALRRLGGTALRTVFGDLDGARRGAHDLKDAGAAGELTGAARPWEYGDDQPIDVVRTVGNAVRRSFAMAGPPLPVQLDVADFEVAETERRTTAAVALCVDLSFSMVMEGRWGPMKQTALALSHLIATRYPQDALQIIGFDLYALPLTQQELAAVDPDRPKGTNLQHALRLAGRHLRRHPDADPVVLVVTDGEPTAHLLDDGEAVFSWPPTRQTIRETIAEVDLLTRYGATLNLFMLGEDDGLRRFVDAVARRSGGRVFSPEAEELGRYVVDDYVRSRRGKR